MFFKKSLMELITIKSLLKIIKFFVNIVCLYTEISIFLIKKGGHII